MLHIDGPFARIVVGYDGSTVAQTALRQSVALAEQYGGTIVAVHVADFPTATVLPIPTGAIAHANDPEPTLRSLQGYQRELYSNVCESVAGCTRPVSMEFLTDSAARGILDAALRWRATAIAVGTHARTGVTHALVGSVADEVLHGADVAVIVTRDGGRQQQIGRVVVGIDASASAENARNFAVALGLQPQVGLVFGTVSDTASLMHTNADLPFDPTPLLSDIRASARKALDRALRYAHRADVFPQTEIVDASDVGAGLCEIADRQNADVIVVGNHKRNEIERLFVGSTARSVLLGTSRTVIVVPEHANVLAETVSSERPAEAVRERSRY